MPIWTGSEELSQSEELRVPLSTVTDVAAAAELNIQEGTATPGGPRKDTAANRIGDAAATDEYLNLAEHRRLRRDRYLATASGGSFNLASVFVETDPDITPLLTTLPSSAATATKARIDQIAAQPRARAARAPRPAP